MGCTQQKYIDKLLSAAANGKCASRKIQLRIASAKYLKAKRY